MQIYSVHFNKITVIYVSTMFGLISASISSFHDYWIPTVKYNLGDIITARVTLPSLPSYVTVFLRNSYTEIAWGVYDEDNGFTRKLSELDDGDELIVIFYAKDQLIKMHPIIKFKLSNHTLIGEERHMCLDHCDIVLDDCFEELLVPKLSDNELT